MVPERDANASKATSSNGDSFDARLCDGLLELFDARLLHGGLLEPLAHPARRRLLELLRYGPKTTGELAQQFQMSRFGVMKHLRVLRDAGWINVRRVGRYRHNALDAAAIRRVLEQASPHHSSPPNHQPSPVAAASTKAEATPGALPLRRGASNKQLISQKLQLLTTADRAWADLKALLLTQTEPTRQAEALAHEFGVTYRQLLDHLLAR